MSSWMSFSTLPLGYWKAGVGKQMYITQDQHFVGFYISFIKLVFLLADLLVSPAQLMRAQPLLGFLQVRERKMAKC